MYVFTQTLSINNKVLILEFETNKLDLNLLINAIWAFIDHLLSNPNLEITLDEYLKIFKYNSYFTTSNINSIDGISNLSQTLHDKFLKVQDLLIGGTDYNFNFSIDEFIKCTREIFNIENLNVIILGNQEKLNHDGFLKDPYYNFEYKIYDLDLCFQNYNFPKFYILESNPYVKISHSELNKLINESMNVKSGPIKLNENIEPKLLDYSNNYEIWKIKTNTSFLIQTSFQINLSISNTVENFILIELLTSLLGEILISKFYNCELVTYSWCLNSNYVNLPSISVYISGPNIGFEFFLSNFINEIKRILVEITDYLTYKKFVQIKNKLILNYKNLQNEGEVEEDDDNSMKQIIAASILLLEDGIFSLEERFETLEIIEKNDVVTLVDKILNEYHCVIVLVFGNVLNTDVFKIDKIVNYLTNHQRINLKEMSKPINQSSLYLTQNYFSTILNSNLKDPNDVHYYYIQICQRSNEKLRYKTNKVESKMIEVKKKEEIYQESSVVEIRNNDNLLNNFYDNDDDDDDDDVNNNDDIYDY
ncbi:unnamed protein product [Candida verbasci]|uniref:Uncharacterized protein n=1 Tax=Candida verbasci TaxID=1227364 RepID=A0A9W4TRS1_9ASCO|nr:unnamed protein product [Candida verbasci]